MEEIHEPTGDEELTIDLDFGSNHDLSSRPDPIRSNPFVNKKPLNETTTSNKKSLTDTISKIKSKENNSIKRKSRSLGIFDENLNDREKSPKKKNPNNVGKLSNVIIKQEVIELSSEEEMEPEKTKLGAKRHLTIPRDTPSKKQKLEKELTVTEYCDVFEKMSNFVGKRLNTPIFTSVALKRHSLKQHSTKPIEILKLSEEKHKSELRIRRKNEHHTKLLDFSKAKSIFAGRNQTGAERRAEIISDLDQQIRNQKQIDYQYRLKKSDFEDSKRIGRGDKEGHEIKTNE